MNAYAMPPLAAPAPTRERILAAARSLLRTHGYAGFTMEGVASECALTRRTLYNRFADRDALYRASRVALLEAFESGLPREIDAAGDPRETIEAFVTRALDALTHPAHVELARSASLDRAGFPWIAQLHDDRVRLPLCAAVERYLAARALPSGGGEVLVAMLFAALGGASRTPVFTPAELTAIFLDRLGARR